jgi:hypothetical protein
VPNLTTLEVYDPATDTWTTKASMPTAREMAGVGVLNGQLYVVGGMQGNSNTVYDANEAYDPVTDTWTLKAPMSINRGGLAVGVIGSQLYAVAGAAVCYVCVTSDLLEMYTPTDTPAPTPTPTPEPTPTPTPIPTPTPQVEPPTNKEQCKNGGWLTFNAPRAFKNQGDCIQFVNTGK